jgi:RNA polymerase sigma-70 factor (ECF subfamily)
MEVPLDVSREVQAFLQGEPLSLAQVRRSIEQVVRTFHAADSETQKDLVQEAMTRLYASLRAGRFRGTASLDTYAQSVARYTCIESLRRQRAEGDPSVEELPSAASWSRPEEMLIRKEEFENQLRAFGALTPDTREILRLVFFERLSYREVAVRLGVNEGTLRSRIHRCRSALRAAVDQTSDADRRSAVSSAAPRLPGDYA